MYMSKVHWAQCDKCLIRSCLPGRCQRVKHKRFTLQFVRVGRNRSGSAFEFEFSAAALMGHSWPYRSVSTFPIPLAHKRRVTEGGWWVGAVRAPRFRPSVSVCTIRQDGWQPELPLVRSPPQRVIASDDAETIVQSEEGLARTWCKRGADRERRPKK